MGKFNKFDKSTIRLLFSVAQGQTELDVQPDGLEFESDNAGSFIQYEDMSEEFRELIMPIIEYDYGFKLDE